MTGVKMARPSQASGASSRNGAAPAAAAALYRRPGFLLRHSHQIAVAIFVESCRDHGLTPGQYGSLALIAGNPGIDQRTLAERIGLDRSTTGAIVNRLAGRRLVRRRVKPNDRRGRALELTEAGERLLHDAHGCAATAQRRLMEPLTPREQGQFVTLLDRLVRAHQAVSRAPFKPAGDKAAPQPINGRTIGRIP
jgi:DNA-binding MarR family transcriptional regulator